jgi:hypothetical protein
MKYTSRHQSYSSGIDIKIGSIEISSAECLEIDNRKEWENKIREQKKVSQPGSNGGHILIVLQLVKKYDCPEHKYTGYNYQCIGGHPSQDYSRSTKGKD